MVLLIIVEHGWLRLRRRRLDGRAVLRRHLLLMLTLTEIVCSSRIIVTVIFVIHRDAIIVVICPATLEEGTCDLLLRRLWARGCCLHLSSARCGGISTITCTAEECLSSADLAILLLFDLPLAIASGIAGEERVIVILCLEKCASLGRLTFRHNLLFVLIDWLIVLRSKHLLWLGWYPLLFHLLLWRGQGWLIEVVYHVFFFRVTCPILEALLDILLSCSSKKNISISTFVDGFHFLLLLRRTFTANLRLLLPEIVICDVLIRLSRSSLIFTEYLRDAICLFELGGRYFLGTRLLVLRFSLESVGKDLLHCVARV